MTKPLPPSSALKTVLDSAARLQEVVPDAVLVGGTAAALYAGHRESADHDHVLLDLKDRFEQVLEAIESTEGWVTNRVVPGKIILGTLGDIEAGVRQMIRRCPLEVERVELGDGKAVRVPTWAETLRVKAYLIVRRNQVRDFLHVAALSSAGGVNAAAEVLSGMDRYYGDQRDSPDGIASQVLRQLSEPRPADAAVTRELAHYKNLSDRWHDWQAVVDVCREVADQMLEGNQRSAE